MPAWANPDVAMALCKELSEVYAESTAKLLRLVAERLARGIDQPGWAEAKLLEQAGLRNDARAIVDLLDVMGPDAADRAIREAHDLGRKGATVELRAAGITTEAGGVTAGFGSTHTLAVDALVRESVSVLHTAHGDILRQVDDVYRQVVARSSPQVLTGTVTRRQAAQAALDRFADRGVVEFIDRAGKRWALESYAEMATRTSVGRAQVQGSFDVLTEHGRDLVIVSDAPQECATCRRWEGKVLSITGATAGYPTTAEARADGLWHSNCRHRAAAYVEGLTRPMEHTADPEGDALRQQQRYLERGLRRWKRREAAALDPAARKAAHAKVLEWQARLREHVDGNGLKRLRAREQIGSAI